MEVGKTNMGVRIVARRTGTCEVLARSRGVFQTSMEALESEEAMEMRLIPRSFLTYEEEDGDE